MDSDERLTALKKAYADIILNTAKEAAARIMVSERKALRFQHELSVAKEEAFGMLLRLKQMLDSKISESEMMSLSQQRKIEELEAQLQEAEDIVRDLREELREVQDELERVTNEKVLDERDAATSEEKSEENRLYTSQSTIFPPSESGLESVLTSDMKNSNMDQRNEGHKYYSPVLHMGNSFVGNPDIPSIILRSKEPELYRNGCTQRIRACERNLLDGQISLSEGIDDAKNETNVREADEGERTCPTTNYEAENMWNIEKKEPVQPDSRLGSWSHIQAVKSFRRKRKRGTRYRKNKTPSCRNLSSMFTKIDQAPDISCSRTHLDPVKSNVQSIQDSYKMASRLSSDPSETVVQPGHEGTTESKEGYVRAGSVQNTKIKDETVKDKLVPTRLENGSTDCSGVPVCIMNLEKVDVPLVNPESKTSDTTKGIPGQPVNDRIIKYTFQRKRKRESMSTSDGNSSLEKCTLKKKTVEKQNGSLDPQKSSLITESSRDSRRLAQVARQLISLSEKKWWQ